MPRAKYQNFSDFFFENIAIFVALKKIIHLDFPSNLKENTETALVFSQFPNSNFKPMFFLHASVFCLSHI